MKFVRTSILAFILFPHFLFGTGNAITGQVKISDTENTLANVIVKIQGSNFSTTTDSSGRYLLTNLPTGKHYLLFIKKGFYSLVIPDVKVTPGKYTVLDVEMFFGDQKEYLFLEIGGIQVTARRELLSEEAETVHHITSGEIEHMQANSLADVLDMIPGNEKTGNLGLAAKQQINLRSFNDQASSFGTKVIIDDVPLSNNADLQTGVGVGYGSLVTTSSGWGYDLREVVAENLEKVEVSSGASSVEYGDHTSGIVNVKTKMSNVPTRLKLKNNPDTREANLMGSFNLGKTNLVYNLNYGYSERNIRITGDEFHRISGSLKLLNKYWNERLDVKHSFKYNRRLEENNYKIDSTSIRAYNRDHHLTYSQQFTYSWDEVTEIYMRNYVDYKRRNSWKHNLETVDVVYLTDRTTPGTIEAIPSTPIYYSDVRTIGDEWSYGSKLKLERKMFSGDILHRFLAGAEVQTDRNLGKGKTFDILKPPYGHLNTRPRPFDNIPGVTQAALFFEDRISGVLLLPFTMDFGFRLDSYNPTTFNVVNPFKGKDIFAARQGTFFNPRFGIKIKPFDKTQLRFTFSKSSKSPALKSIYPEDYYQDITDFFPTYVPDSKGQDSLVYIPLISTYVYDRSAPDLKGYQITKYEAGLDQQFGNFGFSLAGYYKESKNHPGSVAIPYYYNRYYWHNWPDSSGKEIFETVLEPTEYKKSTNRGWAKSSGFEFSLRTHRIPSLNMRFRVSAAFNFRKSGSAKYRNYYANTRNYSEGDTLGSGWVVPQDMEIIPYYSPNESWRQRMIVKYNIDYIAKSLGIWLTFKAEQKLWEQSKIISKTKLAADGYFYNGKNVDIDPQTSALMELDRTYNKNNLTVDSSRPNDIWLFSIIVSKSLFRGAEVSLFVNNFLNDRGYYKNRDGFLSAANPAMFWGIAFSSKVDDLFK